MTSEDPLATFEDLMAFIDGFDPAPTLNEDEVMQTLFAGVTSDCLNEDMTTMAPSSELWQFLSSAATLENARLVGVTKTSSSQTGQSCSERASSTEPLVAVVTTAATVAGGERKKRTKWKLREEPARPRSLHHERVKQEIRYLRSRAVDLQDQLAALLHGATALSPQQQVLIDSSWKRIARHQLENRAASEAENVRLRAELQNHFEASRSLEYALSERLDDEFVLGNDKPISKKRRISNTWEVEGLAELANELDATFERLDHVISDTAFKSDASGDSAQSCLLRSVVSENGEVTPYMELTDTTVTPFRPALTTRAVWRSVLQHYVQRAQEDKCDTQKIWQTGNTFTAKCRVKYTLKNSDGQEMFLNCKVVLRKYIDEESHMVLIWRAHNEGEDDLAGIYADETGWSVVQPISGTFGHSSSGSVVRTCVHVVQRHRATKFALDPMMLQQHSSVALFTNLVMASNEEDMLGLAKRTETLLLDKNNLGI